MGGNSSILMESFSLQHSEKMKNLLLTWDLDLTILSFKTKIPYVICFEEKSILSAQKTGRSLKISLISLRRVKERI